MSCAVLLPVKAFVTAKRRLASVLDDRSRAELARSMAEAVAEAAHDLPVFVVCDDEEVASWARDRAADVIWSPGKGLNGAVTDGVAHVATEGFEKVIVAHADLPHAEDLRWVADFEGVTLVPDRHDDGTNVACVPAAAGFRFAYGPGSFTRHLAEADRLHLPVRTERDERLGWDVDLPADLAPPGFVGRT